MDQLLSLQKSLLKHSNLLKIIMYCTFIVMGALPASGKAIASLTLLEYDNPSHRELKGRSCNESGGNFTHLGVCNNHFSLCLDEIGSSDTMDYCSYLKLDDFHSANGNFVFPSSFGFLHKNPIVFEILDFRGVFQVKMDIWDTEAFHVNSEGHIDFYKEDIYTKPSSMNINYHTLHGRGYSRTKIAVKVFCASHYYDDKCSTYCRASDGDRQPRYTCDTLTGAKTCTPGFEGPMCKTVSKLTLWYWILIAVSTVVVIGTFLGVCYCRTLITKHSEKYGAFKSGVKHRELTSATFV